MEFTERELRIILESLIECNGDNSVRAANYEELGVTWLAEKYRNKLEEGNKLVKKIKDLVDKGDPRYEVYEDNSGGVYFCILSDGEPVKIIGFLEYADAPGEVLRMITALLADPTIYEFWYGDVVEYMREQGKEVTYKGFYDSANWALIGDNEGVYMNAMGLAGRRAYGFA